MAWETWKNHTHYTQFIVLIIFTPLGIAVTVWRFVATHRSARKPGLEDWMAAIAVLFATLVNLGGLMAISILNGRSLEQEIAEAPSDYAHTRQWDFAALYFYFFHTLSVKFSVLALYYRIFGVRKAFRVWIYILGSAQAILILLLSILHPLQCQPFERYFDRSIPGTCRDDGMTILVGETPNSLIDIAMIILAMYMIRPLQLKSNVKWSLRILLGMGVFVGIIGFIKIGVTYSAAQVYAFSLVSIWTCVQMFVSILCSCLPVVYYTIPKGKFPKYGSWRLPTSYLRFGQPSHGSTGLDPVKRSGNSENEAYSSEDRGRSWRPLHEVNSMSIPTWPDTEHHTESLALKNYPAQDGSNEAAGIRVERRFEVI